MGVLLDFSEIERRRFFEAVPAAESGGAKSVIQESLLDEEPSKAGEGKR